MKYFAVSDNVDTLTGLRLTGIEGTLAHKRDEVYEAVSSAVADPDVGVLLITERLAGLCPDVLDSLKKSGSRLLVVEIPDRHGTGRSPDSITRYIKQAIGVKIS